MLSPVEVRHRIHANPELMFEEFQTTELLVEQLQDLEGITIHRPLPTGLVIEYKVNDGPFILFRGDMDALPIKEETGVPFASQNDYMHACGHDVHTSNLYAFLLEVLAQKLNKNVLFLFQPGEEGGGGAQRIIDSGILDKFNISRAVALHVTDDYPLGTIATTNGVLFAAAIEINIDVRGKSAHVAFPENGKNALKSLRKTLDRIDNFIENLEGVVLFGNGKLTSGTARNIIPSQARAECTLRTLSAERQQSIISEIRKLAETTDSEIGTTTSFSFSVPFTEVVVDSALYNAGVNALKNDFEVIDCGYKLTAEDFGLLSKKYPAFMFWLGTSTGEKHGLHTPLFFPPDSTLEYGTRAFKLLLDSLAV